MERRTLVSFALVVTLAASLVSSLASAQEPVPAPPPVETFPRFRLGGSIGVGGGSGGIAGDASARAGVQATREIAVTYQLSAVGMSHLFGESTSWVSHAVLLEWVTPWPALVIGVGPSFIMGKDTTNCFLALSGSCTPTTSAFMNIGVDARIALVIGSYGTNARGGFTIQAAIHGTPGEFAATLGIGFDLY